MTELHAQIREILLRQWDPIGVADVPQAQDEYDSYVGEIASAVLAGHSASEIADHLVLIETDEMGLSGDRTRALRAASSLARLLSR
jgi:hypothetical protein